MLSVTFAHTAVVGRLPARHRDPVDRMPLAHARAGRIILECPAEIIEAQP